VAKRGGKGSNGGAPVVIIRRGDDSGHGHHGGAWKIAYADFVTAMMAFFLLLWLINSTSDEQRRGLADYFAPTSVLGRTYSGSGLPFGGRTPSSAGDMSSDGAMLPPLNQSGLPQPSEAPDDLDDLPEPGPRPATSPQPGDAVAPSTTGQAPAAGEAPPRVEGPAVTRLEDIPDPDVAAEAERRRRAQLARAAEELRATMRDDPALAELARQVLVEEVPEGLRVQMLDAEGRPVFATGVAAPNDRGRALLMRVGAVLARLPYPIEIAGHTDATPFRGGGDRSNWELSAERANATRRLLLDAGVAEGRIHSVTGMADRQPLIPTRPTDAANRRVAVLVMLPQGAAIP
jgi:chemotaxis protein MotB